MTDYPNALNRIGFTPICSAALFGHIEIVKILAPLTDNPNAPDNYGLGAMEWLKNLTYGSVSKAPARYWYLKHLLHCCIFLWSLDLKLIKFFWSIILRFEFASPSSQT